MSDKTLLIITFSELETAVFQVHKLEVFFRSTEIPEAFSILPSLEEDLSGHLELGNQKIDTRQQKINSGFEEMQNRWMGLQYPAEFSKSYLLISNAISIYPLFSKYSIGSVGEV